MTVTGLYKSFDSMPVLSNLSMEIPEGRITAILGPSGCGKTTFLRICAGLLEVDGSVGEGLAAMRNRKASFLFQEPRLLPWETALQNVELVLGSLQQQERRERAMRFIDLVGLGGYATHRPSSLSGGMRQRVSMARSFAYESEVLYMDEPFQGLDLELKLGLTVAFRKLWEEDSRTVLLVTHDVLEAVLLGDQIVVLTPRPASVREVLLNPVPAGERSLSHEKTLSLQGRLYDLLLSTDTPHSEA